MKASEWRDWLNSPVTKAVMQHLSEEKDKRLERLLNLEETSWETLAIKHVALRSELSALGEILEIDSLKESIGVTNED